MDSLCNKQTVCKVLNIFQYGKYLVAYVLKHELKRYKNIPMQGSRQVFITIWKLDANVFDVRF